MKFIVVAFAFIASASAVALKQSERIADTDTASTGANPVRKVVTMLQMMIKKIEAQGKKEQELFDKYMCYCKTSDLTLTKEIEEANTKIPQLESEIKEAVEHKATLEVELNSHMTDRDAAKTAMASVVLPASELLLLGAAVVFLLLLELLPPALPAPPLAVLPPLLPPLLPPGVLLFVGPVTESVPPATAAPKGATATAIAAALVASVVHTVLEPLPVQQSTLDSWAVSPEASAKACAAVV